MANAPDQTAVKMTQVYTVVEPFGVPGMPSTGKPHIPIPQFAAPVLAAIGWLGESDKASVESTVLERDGLRQSRWGIPEIDVSYIGRYFDSLKPKPKKPAAAAEPRAPGLLAPLRYAIDGSSYAPCGSRPASSIITGLYRMAGDMGYAVELSDGPFRAGSRGKLCNGYHFGDRKKVKANRMVGDDELAYIIAHELSHARMGEGAAEGEVDADAKYVLRRLGASRSVVAAADRMFRASEGVRRAA